jgi:hypothetical protein
MISAYYKRNDMQQQRDQIAILPERVQSHGGRHHPRSRPRGLLRRHGWRMNESRRPIIPFLSHPLEMASTVSLRKQEEHSISCLPFLHYRMSSVLLDNSSVMTRMDVTGISALPGGAIQPASAELRFQE